MNIPQRICQIRPRRVILSGIQPTGIPHLGNYLGALSNWVKLQKSAQPEDKLLFSIVGWHALTLPQDPAALIAARNDMLAVLLAIGIDPNRSILFHQDHNPHHTELSWILSCIAPMGKLRRMTTWKSRLAAARNSGSEDEVDESMLNAGLFMYPVLQAADVLVYKATHVPVGDDQQQHIELTRDLADIFNPNLQRNVSPVPPSDLPPSKRILSLKDPTSKMSKSSPDAKSRILLTDTASQIQSKIRAAVTDSIQGITYDPDGRPGTSNLLTILAACTDSDVTQPGPWNLKRDVAEAVEEFLKKPRAQFDRIRLETTYLDEVARRGVTRAIEHSKVTMMEVKTRLGLASRVVHR
ncbi:tryptophanyl-tRNA synthetase [Suillus occidentalis]|nr:tryptophanyl-tRNA synthetase [Suillus occidentalis]